MGTHGITCEQNFLIPQDVTIEKIKKEEKGVDVSNKVIEQAFEVNAKAEELRETFSLDRNEYLKCKWEQFLENVPRKVLVIKPYLEYQKKKDPVRKMILNGAYYLDSGKLAPIPYKGAQR